MTTNKDLKVYKGREINAADFDNFTLNDYQVYINLIAKIGGVDCKGDYLPAEELQRKHVLTAKEFSDNFNTELSYSYKVIKGAVDKLMKTDIKIKEEKGYARINVCSYAKYNEGEGFVDVEFTDRIMPFLAQVTEKFTLYNLREISEFRSFYSLRLYELIQGYKDTGWFSISVEKLRVCFSVTNKFKLYGDFKRKTFAHAIEEINSIYKMDLQVEEIKQGRKVATLKFTYNKTKIDGKRYNPKNGKHTNIYREIERQEVSKNKPTKDIVLEGQMKFEDAPKKNYISSTLNNMFKA
jgi:plasmid replication initiation protein